MVELVQNLLAKKSLQKININKQYEPIKGLFYDGAVQKWIAFDYDDGELSKKKFNKYDDAVQWLN